MKQLTKPELIAAIRKLPLNFSAKTFKEADEWCQKHPEFSPHICIITSDKTVVK